MKIVIAIDSLKGCLSSIEAANAIKKGIENAKLDAKVIIKPLAIRGKCASTDEVVSKSIEAAKAANYVNCEDLVVVSAGSPFGISGTTNLIKVEIV